MTVMTHKSVYINRTKTASHRVAICLLSIMETIVTESASAITETHMLLLLSLQRQFSFSPFSDLWYRNIHTVELCCLGRQSPGPRRGQGMILSKVNFCQSGQLAWGIHQGPVEESWFCYGIFLYIDWTAWCFLVLLPPRIYQIHMPDNLEEMGKKVF